MAENFLAKLFEHNNWANEQIKSMLTALGIAPPSIDGWDHGEAAKALVPISR